MTVFATVVALLPIRALAAGSLLESETFATNATAAGQWSLPAGQGGTNGACLTAGPVSATTSIPNCASPPDVSGSGALRLTTNAGNAVGAVFYQASLPTSEGLDITLDTYQFNGTGADGIVFSLAAANPANPVAACDHRTARRRPRLCGEHPGLTRNRRHALRIPRHRPRCLRQLREHAARGGSGCTIPSPLVANRAYPEAVTARGPGIGTVGYCILGTTATTYNHSSGGGSGGGTISNVGTGNTLDKQTATSRAGDMVPVEMAINPSGAATTTASGLSSRRARG